MKRNALILCAALALALNAGTAQVAHAGWGTTYGGYQPWWNPFASRDKCLSPEEERLQRFWHDYYDAMRCYYGALDHMDWVAYYKNHGYQINSGCCGPNGTPCRINYAPVFVSPTIQWAVPNNCLSGPPAAPQGFGGGMPGGCPGGACPGGYPGMQGPAGN